MIQLSIPIPSLPGPQDIDIEMNINGEKHKMHFRIELYQWDDCKSAKEKRVECIRQLAQDYGDEWMIYNIGVPNDRYVPMTFVKTADWVKQREWLMSAVLG